VFTFKKTLFTEAGHWFEDWSVVESVVAFQYFEPISVFGYIRSDPEMTISTFGVIIPTTVDDVDLKLLL
jgi:hypothetical protein